ncbi:MAG: hypothetical protein IKW19_09635 [Akkermansia sp.]|jgi:hypothetical protein|nr:hypothetical protein [Akkermansia sp.]
MTPEEIAMEEDRDNRIIAAGVSDEALAALKRRLGYDLPVFQRCDKWGIAYSDEQFHNQALVRDGQRSVIYYILQTKNQRHD